MHNANKMFLDMWYDFVLKDLKMDVYCENGKF